MEKLDRMGQTYEKRFVRYPTGARMYDMSQRSFEELAKKANAISKVGRMALVDRYLVDEYLEMCRIVD